MRSKRDGGELFIVDNSDADWKVGNYLREWTELSNAFDVATGNFEIGGLLSLDGHWQQLERTRILMGDEITLRTRRAFEEGLRRVENTLDDSLEAEKEGNDFLVGIFSGKAHASPNARAVLSRYGLQCDRRPRFLHHTGRRRRRSAPRRRLAAHFHRYAI